MAGFLYYVPNAKLGATPADLAAAGIAHAIDALGYATGRVTGGPDGGDGLLLGYFPKQEHLVRYLPDKQDHRKIPGTDAWVLWYKDDLPTPDELARPIDFQLAGRPVRLLDDREWVVPVIRAWGADDDGAGWELQLPTCLGVDGDGQWCRGEIVPRFAELWRQGMRWAEVWFAGFGEAMGRERPDDDSTSFQVELDAQEQYDLATACLGVNYRLGPVEATVLGLLSEPHGTAILNTATGIDTFLAYLSSEGKKKRDCSVSTDSGPDSTPGTGPASES